MKKITIALLLVLLILVGATFLYKEKVQKPSELQDITITQAFEVFLYAPLYIAQEKGFFTQQGLRVKIATAGGDDKAFASLISGDAQLAVGDPTFTAVAGEKGRKGQVVGSLLNGVPFWGIAKDKNISVLNSPSQLGRYKVATFPAPSTAYALQVKMFNEGGLVPNIAQLAFGSLIPAVESGNADIALELEPNVSTAVKNGFHIVYPLSQYYPNFAITGITALPSYIQSDPDVIQKVINAIQQADTFIRTNPEETADILARKFPDVPRDIAVDALKNIISANVVPESLVVDEVGWNTAIQLRKDTGDIKNDAPFAEYIVNDFATNASNGRN